MLRKYKFTYVCINSSLTNEIVKYLRYAPTSWPGDFIPDEAITSFPHYSLKFEISHPSVSKWPKAHLMLIGDLALKDFLCRISGSLPNIRQHKTTITFTDGNSAIDTSVQLQSKALQLIEYFWWDFPNVEILNALDTDASIATILTIQGPKVNTFLELAQHIEALRMEGNEDFENNNTMAALVKYERARQIYDASIRTTLGHSGRSNTGPDYPNLEEIKMVLFSYIGEAYLKLAKQGGPNQLQLGIAAFNAAKDAFPPPAYYRPTVSQRARYSRCLGAAAHLIGDWVEAKWALETAALLEPDDFFLVQELGEVREVVARRGVSGTRPHPKLVAARKKSKGWAFRFVTESMNQVKFE